MVNPTITSQSPDYGFEYYWNDEECDVRGQWCCQRNAFRALGVVPPLNASLDIEWNPEVSGVVIDTQFVRTHVNLHLADKCEGNDVNSNFTCDANLQLYEDAELTRDYEAETCMPYLDGSRVYALVNISDQCCSLQNRYMEIIQARVCWSTNEVQLVAFDEGYPDETGCNTAGADVQTIIVYDAYDEYDPACEATITNGTGCSRVVAWKAIMHSSPETVNVIEIDWQLTLIPPPLLLGQPQSELHTTGFTMNSPERDLQRSAYENLVNPGMPMGMGAPLLGAGEIGDIDFDAEEFFIQCNESDLVWSWEDHACIHDHFWHWSSHVLFIIGACVLALLIIACIIGCAYSHHHHDDDDEEHHHRHHHKHDEVEYVRPVVNEYTFAYRMPSQPVDDAGKVKNI